jgi:hypothetical protein
MFWLWEKKPTNGRVRVCMEFAATLKIPMVQPSTQDQGSEWSEISPERFVHGELGNHS